MNGKLILLDEPFKGLDQQLKERIIGRLWEKQTLGRTVILVTHDEKDAQWLAEQVIPFPD